MTSATLPPPQAGTLLVFADDWGRHPSSAQHLIQHLLPRYRVGWVNTIGMRPPRLDWHSAKRAVGKFSEWTSRSSQGESNGEKTPEVLSPRMWPWFRRPWDRALNQRLLRGPLARWLDESQEPRVAVTTLPITADLIGQLPVDRWIYYCVDDFASWPGLDAAPLLQMEEDLLRRVDRVIAVSETLRARAATVHDNVSLLTHGVDLAHWGVDGGRWIVDGGQGRGERAAHTEADGPLSEYPGPRIVFWGLVDRRLDLAFLQQLDEDLTTGTILLVGPENNPDPELSRLRRLQRIGPVPYAQLPALARQADVLVMPYIDEQVTRMMQPLKLLEYLVTGRPVVTRSLPATVPWADCLDLAENPADFSQTVRKRLQEGIPAEQIHARRRLEAESWSAKAGEFERLIFAPTKVGE